jgi:hypothetical protein
MNGSPSRRQATTRQSRRARHQAGFSEDDLKELRKAIKAKDSNRIAELMSKIVPRVRKMTDSGKIGLSKKEAQSLRGGS